MAYSDLPIPDRHPSDAALAWFGDPDFELVEQPGLRIASWQCDGPDDVATILVGSYYLADDEGRFSVLGRPELGNYLRGRLFIEAPGATREASWPPNHAALAHHLRHVVTTDRINQPGTRDAAGTPEWHAEIRGWRNEVYTLTPRRAGLDIDGRRIAGIGLAYGGYSATTVAVAGRLVTLVLHDCDAPRVDTRLVRRPA